MAQARRKAAGQSGSERAVTRRVVLRKARVLLIPADEADPVKFAEHATEPDFAEAWVECGEFTGGLVPAIEQFAGKPGEADAKLGEFKAPPVRSWHGGVLHSQPALPKIERQLIR